MKRNAIWLRADSQSLDCIGIGLAKVATS